MNLRQRMRLAGTLSRVGGVFTERLRRFGPQPQGVIWNDAEGQRLRFQVLDRVMRDDPDTGLAVNDLGCGYGALFDHLAATRWLAGGRYVGYDISPAMVKAARRRIHDPRARFLRSAVATKEADYCFVSGTWNLKLDADAELWTAYVQRSLRQLWQLSRRGLAFNLLDVARGRGLEGLYYGDGEAFLAHCRRDLTSQAELVADYPLNEWTILLWR